MRTRVCLWSFLFITISTAGAAHGQERVPRISLRETAALLARSGAVNNDARTVLAAAQLLITAERTSPGLRLTDPPPTEALRPAEAPKGSTATPVGLLRLASAIAVELLDETTARQAALLAADSIVGLGNPALAAELAQAADEITTTRGAQGGPIWADGQLAAGESVEFELGFEGGRVPNMVSVSASSSNGDLDCYLYVDDTIVARDAGYEGDCSIRWDQEVSGRVTLRIRNTGATTYFVLSSN